jgi:hypothetical protein
MRLFALLLTALLFTLCPFGQAKNAPSDAAVEIERSTSAPPVHLRKEGAAKASSKVTHSQSNSFTFSSGGSDFKFNFDGGWDGNGFRFNMSPGPKQLIQQFWLTPFKLLSRGRMVVLWLALSLATAAMFQSQVRRAGEELRRAPARSIVLGIIWNLAFWALLAACVLLCLILIGVPLVITLVAFHFALAVFGMTLTFSVVGEWLARRINQSTVSIYVAILVGACFLGLLRVLPVFGPVIWFVAGLFGTGAALAFLGTLRSPVRSAPAMLA